MECVAKWFSLFSNHFSQIVFSDDFSSEWMHVVRVNTVWSWISSTAMQACGSKSCNLHSRVWWVMHHQWSAACPSSEWAILVLVSTIVACTNVPHSKSAQMHPRTVSISCPWTPLRDCQCLATSKHSVICGDWWREFSIHWYLDAFPLFLFIVNADSFEL